MGAGQSEFRGTMYWNRTTFVVGPDGIVRKTYANVNPQGHERVLLDDIKRCSEPELLSPKAQQLF
jgi:peroxiredoxin Q/BCP